MPPIFNTSTTMAGQVIGAPNVCMVPAPPVPEVPVPTVSVIQVMQATKTATKVKVAKRPAVLVQSEVPTSMGDPPPFIRGVVSSVIMNKGIVKSGTIMTKIEGKQVGLHTGLWSCNGANPNVPASPQAVPSQAMVKMS